MSFRTIGYLEELELTLTVVSMIFKDASKIKKINSKLFELYFYVLTNRTIGLLSAQNSKLSQYKAVSWIEMELEKVRLKSDSNDKTVSLTPQEMFLIPLGWRTE